MAIFTSSVVGDFRYIEALAGSHRKFLRPQAAVSAASNSGKKRVPARMLRATTFGCESLVQSGPRLAWPSVSMASVCVASV